MKTCIRKLLTALFILSVFVLLIACGGDGDGNRTPAVDMSGTWSGTWESSYGLSGTFTANIAQDGSTLSGSIDVYEIGTTNASLKGTVEGNTVVFGDIDDTITFTGTVSGDSVSSGTYVYPFLSDEGTWQGAKS